MGNGKNRFPCIKCGLCCRMIGNIPAMRDYHSGDGVCMYLRDNLCSIYKRRPDICNLEKVYSSCFRGMSRKDFYCVTLKSCCELAFRLGSPATEQTLLRVFREFSTGQKR
jgi:Fe-S-cluster containining protein